MIDCVEIFNADMNNEEISWESTGVDARVCSFMMMGIKNPYLIKCLSYITGIIQIVISTLSVFVVGVKLFKAIIVYRHPQKKYDIKSQRLFLVFTPLFLPRLEKTDLKENQSNTSWIIGPNLKKKVCLPERIHQLYWENYLRRSDLLKSYFDVIRICIKYPFSTKMVFPIYRYWELCLVSKSLERITSDKCLFFSNQMDRWALLFDRLPSKAKTLLQHGIDVDYGGKLVKLKNIDSFYSISKGTWQNSYQFLLDCKPELHIMKPSIELSNIDSDKVTVLIISHIIYFETEKNIIEALKDLPIQIFVKKHPTVIDDAVYRDLQKQYGFVYITDNTFPQVDYVISYESTLAYEYMNFDVPVTIYSQNEPIQIEKIKNNLITMI